MLLPRKMNKSAVKQMLRYSRDTTNYYYQSLVSLWTSQHQRSIQLIYRAYRRVSRCKWNNNLHVVYNRLKWNQQYPQHHPPGTNASGTDDDYRTSLPPLLIAPLPNFRRRYTSTKTSRWQRKRPSPVRHNGIIAWSGQSLSTCSQPSRTLTRTGLPM